MRMGLVQDVCYISRVDAWGWNCWVGGCSVCPSAETPDCLPWWLYRFNPLATRGGADSSLSSPALVIDCRFHGSHPRAGRWCLTVQIFVNTLTALCPSAWGRWGREADGRPEVCAQLAGAT